MSRSALLATLCITFCVLGLASMFIGAYLHDHYHTLTKDQVFIAPLLCVLGALVCIVLGWIEERQHG